MMSRAVGRARNHTTIPARLLQHAMRPERSRLGSASSWTDYPNDYLNGTVNDERAGDRAQ